MPLNITRLRMLMAALAILLIAVVAGFYFYARFRVRSALQEVPQKLGINIQQSTQGFSLSKSEGGRTLFTVRASKAVQYKEGGRAELRDVNIIVYGRQSNRFDQIYGADFEYDAKTGDVSAKGEVHIDLQANAEGGVQPDQAPPQELKNPIHLKTSGLVFNQKTGLARTAERIEFRVPQASGSALGAEYDSKAATLTLEKNIQITTTGDHAAQIEATHGAITKGPNRAVLDGVRVRRASGGFEARQLTVYLRDDNTVEHIVGSGEVKADTSGSNRATAQGPRADVFITEQNALRSAVLSGGVSFAATMGTGKSQSQVEGTAGKVDLAFAAKNLLTGAVASQNVNIKQKPAGPGDTVQIISDAINFDIGKGHRLERAVTSGAAQVQVASGGTNTRATAGHFEATFDNRSRLSKVIGLPDAKVTSSAAGQPEKTSSSDRVEVSFNSTGGVASLVQQGNFHYVEAATTAGGSQREVWAQTARYSPATSALQLSGSPRVVEGGMTTTANAMTMNRRTGQAQANGDVKTTYSELKPQLGGALLATSDPIHVTAAVMDLQQTGGTAAFSGGARLWQGSNIVEAPVINFDREKRTIIAESPQKDAARQVSTVFTQQDKNGKATPVTVTAARLAYSDEQRQAHFTGGVTVRGADAAIMADQMDIYLLARTQNQKSESAAPSQLDRVVAHGNVVIQQPNRRATGQTLTYVVAEGKFTMVGGSPSIFDAERGKITGDSLTFYTRDDRVLVESKTSPTVTQTRVAK